MKKKESVKCTQLQVEMKKNYVEEVTEDPIGIPKKSH